MTSPLTGFPDGFSGETAVYLTGQDSVLRFTTAYGDVWYGTENHELTVTKSKFPVETGVQLVDHAVREPAKLTLTGVVSSVSLRPRDNYRVIPGDNTVVPAIEERRELISDHPLQIRAAGNAWQQIAQFMSDNSVFTVDTLYGRYRNMMLTRANGYSDGRTGTSMNFTLELEEILYADQIASAGELDVEYPEENFDWGDQDAEYSTLPKGWEGRTLPFDLGPEWLDPFRGHYWRIPLGGRNGGRESQTINVNFSLEFTSTEPATLRRSPGQFSSSGYFPEALITTTIRVQWLSGDDAGYWAMDTPYYPDGVTPGPPLTEIPPERAELTTPELQRTATGGHQGQRMYVNRFPIPRTVVVDSLDDYAEPHNQDPNGVTREVIVNPEYPIATFRGAYFVVIPEDPLDTTEMNRYSLGVTHHLYLVDIIGDTYEAFAKHVASLRAKAPPPGYRKEIGYYRVSELSGRPAAAAAIQNGFVRLRKGGGDGLGDFFDDRLPDWFIEITTADLEALILGVDRLYGGVFYHCYVLDEGRDDSELDSVIIRGEIASVDLIKRMLDNLNIQRIGELFDDHTNRKRDKFLGVFGEGNKTREPFYHLGEVRPDGDGIEFVDVREIEDANRP